MIRILVTGFEPFGGEAVNPSWEAVKLLSGWAADTAVSRLLVPTAYEGSIAAVTAACDRLAPQIVLMTGQAGGRCGLSFERIGVNLDEASIPDNAGVCRNGTPIFSGGPAACFSTLPLHRLVQQLQKDGIPAEISNSAGFFVCNHLLYGVLQHIEADRLNIRAGFVHVPFLPGQAASRAGTPSMALEVMVRGLNLTVEMLSGMVREGEL